MAKALKKGKRAPQFVLEDKDQVQVSLNDLKTDYTVLFFYPKDNTPGCTIESKKYSSDLKKFRKLNAMVLGISGGDQKTKTTFCKKNKLTVTLLSDTDFKVAKKYGVYGKKTFMGNTFMGIHRITYLLDKNKKIVKIYDKVSPETHSGEVLDDIKNLVGGRASRAPFKKVKQKTAR